ncbi:heterokaryon incompatibility protein-domain-containing protein [Pisolithus marmoratus]|nr:heterokaryon incompatibility protein-domain-containing protein [Pisolithus marmoratus]
MKLLNIEAVLDRDKGIRRAGHDDTEVLNELDDRTTSYAILSHRWKSDSEVSHKEMIRLMKMGRKERKAVKQRDGYRKIIKSCEQAKKDGYKWLWIDTCCIDKRSSAELSEAINSMYRWYRNSRMCYVYLHDVDKLAFPSEQDFSRFDKSNGWPEWFSRGWTLQELIAPRKAEFFNKDWISIGAKQDLTSVLEVITRIPRDVLRDGQVLRSSSSRERPCIAHVMSWASDRKTERVEDRAYSLLGLFGVNMPMLYGEGSKAFQRLQLEIIRVSSDHSIFAWNPRDQLREDGSILADNPSHFEGCHDIEKVPPKKFYRELMRRIGVDVDADQGRLELLRRGVESPQLSRLDVTNLGIEVSLPVIRDPVSNNIEVILPCSDHDGNLVTVDLQPRGHSFGRCFGAARIPKNVTHAEFTSLYLVWSQDTQESYDHQDTEESCYDLRLDDRRALCHGFTRCGSFPREITGDTVTFSSQRNILIVVVYANDNARSRFAVGLGCYLDKVWASIFCDDCPANKEVWSSWEGFAKQAYDILWDGPTHNSCRNTPNTIKDVHLPQSVCDARVICGSSDSGYTNVVIDIQLCPGCCGGSREHTYTSRSYGLWLPWTSRRNRSHKLQLDGEPTEFDLCSDQGIAVGDYGDSPDGNFRRCGNMFKDFGIDLTNSPYRPVASLVTSCSRSPRRVQTQHEAVVTSSSGENMILHQPKGLSLPNNEEFELLLKALSTTLAGKLLVTAVIQCSQFYKVDHEGRRKNLGDGEFSYKKILRLY